ncbi:hypothetical protein P7K49_012910 [Saguinus oedipus]|uniref:Uncharacterized protein n=1 Tax=Saguinus oedipus TaxID=9490 RepID=A0ABQ9VF96_SAGOE|nr:hypothetical protein P7K49_012910 [Saguinus oedipus]
MDSMCMKAVKTAGAEDLPFSKRRKNGLKHTDAVWVVSIIGTCRVPGREDTGTWKRDPLLRRHQSKWPVGSSPPQHARSSQSHDARARWDTEARRANSVSEFDSAVEPGQSKAASVF